MPVDAQAIPDKLVAVPIQQWHYKREADSGAPNPGSKAQDFIRAIYPGHMAKKPAANQRQMEEK